MISRSASDAVSKKAPASSSQNQRNSYSPGSSTGAKQVSVPSSSAHHSSRVRVRNTAAIFSFYWTWEDFLQPLIYLTDPRMYTVSVALRSFSDPGGVTNWGAVFAMLALSLVPVFLIFVFFQRYIVDGIATSGLK